MRRRNFDKVFFGIVCALIIVGVFVFFSASMGFLNRDGPSFYFVVIKQIALGLTLGLMMMFITSRIDYKNWKKFALPFFLFSIVLSFLVFEPHIGFGHGGARRWLKLGFLSFQPSELLKLSFIIYLSSWLTLQKNEIRSFGFGLLPFLVIVAFAGIPIIFQNDTGTLGIISIIGLVLFTIGGGRFRQIAIIILLGLLLLILMSQFRPHLKDRLNVFFNKSTEEEQLDKSYQINQSLIAIGSGGIKGRGFGMSLQKFKYLPEPMGDSVFAVYAEEFGFLGSIILIGLFLTFLYRGLYISSQSSDLFARLLGSGIAILIVAQSFVNIGAMTGVIPLTGLPLLFISQGGSALFITLAEIGILLNISKNT
ncbi:MAG: putative peptidoglycan glycosyltransferase FtsW [Patescibacteria group bacterium]